MIIILTFPIMIIDIRAFRGGRLPHQPNSLDDLDEADTIPFDNVPVRYDTTGIYFFSPLLFHNN